MTLLTGMIYLFIKPNTVPTKVHNGNENNWFYNANIVIIYCDLLSEKHHEFSDFSLNLVLGTEAILSLMDIQEINPLLSQYFWTFYAFSAFYNFSFLWFLILFFSNEYYSIQ